jgi:predicted metal-dependent phosphotriesterase family hydrolase
MVQTVLGLISPDDLGVTLPHEHFMIYASVYYREPELTSDKPLARQSISIENLNWVRHHQLNSIAWTSQTLPPGSENQTVSPTLR